MLTSSVRGLMMMLWGAAWLGWQLAGATKSKSTFAYSLEQPMRAQIDARNEKNGVAADSTTELTSWVLG